MAVAESLRPAPYRRARDAAREGYVSPGDPAVPCALVDSIGAEHVFGSNPVSVMPFALVGDSGVPDIRSRHFEVLRTPGQSIW